MSTDARGFTVIELLVAGLIFALLASALTHTLIRAQYGGTTSGRWLRATQLAEERLERLRAGDRSDDAGPIGAFTRSWRAAPAVGVPGLERLDVSVEWEDGGTQRFVLSAFARIAP